MRKITKMEILLPTWEGNTGERYWGDYSYESHDNETTSLWLSLRGLVPGDSVVARAQIHPLVFDRSPESLDKNVVVAATATIHADLNLVLDKYAGELSAGELTALIGVEYLGRSVARQRFLECRSQKSLVSVFDSRHANTLRVAQARIAHR